MKVTTLLTMLVTFAFGCVSSTGGGASSAPPPAGERVVRIDGEAGFLRVSDGGVDVGAPVVFVHGLGSDLEVWRAQLAYVRASGRRAVAYDQRGHGQSQRPRDGVYSIDGLMRDLEAVRRALLIPRMVVVAHSFSGDVATAYAAAHPERVAGIVYVDADGEFGALSRERRQEEVDRARRNTSTQWRAEWEDVLGTKAKQATRQQVLASLATTDLRALADLRADNVFFPARELAVKYTGPRWAIETGAPGAEFRAGALDRSIHLVTLAGVSHWMMRDDPDGFDRLLGQALAEMGGAKSD